MTSPPLMGRPLYLQVRDTLVDRIVQNVWKPGSMLPSETDLARDLGASLGTIRKAMGIMEREKIVTRRQGRGTFVNDFSEQPLVLSAIRDQLGQRFEGETCGRMFVTELATKEEAEKLELPEGAEVYRVERLSMHRGAPFLAERCVLPVSKFPKLRPHVGYSLSSLAQHNSTLVGHAVELVRPVAATAAEARDLDISVGTPLLALDRVVFSERGEPIEWRLASCRLGDLQFIVEYL